MPQRFLISDHALQRFAERHEEFDALGLNEARQVFLAELDHGVPFGGQIGGDELYLLPSGYVAAIAWRDGVGVVKTVLTKEQAIANMQSMGAILKPSPEFEHLLGPAHAGETEEDVDRLEAELRLLAEKHLNAGVGKKRRNALLRELGYDPAGKAGNIYRTAYRALLMAQYAARREAYRRQQERINIQPTPDPLPRIEES